MQFQRQWIAYRTIVVKESKRTLRLWMQTLLPTAITTILYFIIFGHVIGPRIGQMDGFDYIKFITPGLIIMSMITNSYAGTVSAFFTAKFFRQIEELMVTPMSHLTMLLGFMTGGMIRGCLVGVVVTIIALFFTHLHVHSIITMIAVSLLSTGIFSLTGLLNGIFATTFDDIFIVPTFVLTPLTYLGGVFYSINLLPHPWKYISYINPIVYIIDTFRFSFLGISGEYLAGAFAAMAFFLLVLLFLSWYLIFKGVGMRS
jgi:ABC-2 type transport system permease protein